MSKLNIDQKTIKELFQDKKSDFLIPDYQRPYAWGENECLTLWEDIFSFAFPDYDYNNFDSENDEYFLGPIVTFKNEDKKLEIIDGQQRLTTLTLLLRAFYSKFDNMRDENSKLTREIIERCLWKTDEFEKPKTSELKIDSDVATDDDKEEFLEILRTGVSKKDNQSRYAKNYRFFQEKIAEFLDNYPSYFSYLPVRILNNCILLPIEADNQDTALRIFSTLNDRGKPLSDADIFKAQFYKYYKSLGLKSEFIEKWKKLEELCNKLFLNSSGNPMDELFTRYMYYERAKHGISSSTTEAVKKFYEKDSYKLLKNQTTLENLIDLADFWKSVAVQDDERFSDRVLRQLYILNYAPNGMWTYFTSVYYLKNRNDGGKLDDEKFYAFLTKTIAFVWAYAIINPGVNSLRAPIYTEMANIVSGQPISFKRYNKFGEFSVKSMLDAYSFGNSRPLTKSMLVWWMFQNPNQELLFLDTPIEIEHIYARNRQNKENSVSDIQKIERIGNKAILEKRINIRASDYRFSDKVKYYQGFENSRKQIKEGTKNAELIELSNNQTDFTEADIEKRSNDILTRFISFLKENDIFTE